MPDLRTLETFFWVAQLGSFRGASEGLHTTQPAISVRIAEMEVAEPSAMSRVVRLGVANRGST